MCKLREKSKLLCVLCVKLIVYHLKYLYISLNMLLMVEDESAVALGFDKRQQIVSLSL